jgi:hypothetical protein
MTHTGPMPESAGTITDTQTCTRHCLKCAEATQHLAQLWESNCGGYEDMKFTCMICGTVEWIDGIDS